MLTYLRDNLKKRLLDSTAYQQLSSFRFIDDIVFKRTMPKTTKMNFLSTVTLSIIQLNLHKKHLLLNTTSYTMNRSPPKKTDQHQIPKSCHKKHCSRVIHFNQAQRIRRIYFMFIKKQDFVNYLNIQLLKVTLTTVKIELLKKANKELLEYSDKIQGANITHLVLSLKKCQKKTHP